MSELEVKVYPAQVEKNNNLGSGSVRVGPIVAKFAIWRNPKFSKGFAISFPFKKGAAPENKIYNEVYFIDKEAEDVLYGKVEAEISGLLNGGGGGQTSSYSSKASSPTTIQRQPDAPGGAPKRAPW